MANNSTDSKYRVSYTRRGMNAVLAATLAASMVPSAALAENVAGGGSLRAIAR